MTIDDNTVLVSYEARCPTCGKAMIEPLERAEQRKNGFIVMECPLHGPFHFRPADEFEAKIVAGEPPAESD